jgi:hypothetical protein
MNLSIYELLKRTGYFDVADKISEKDIYDELILYPDFVDDWLRYSTDKRGSSGWYFTLGTKGYLVGFFSKDGDSRTVYDDKLHACAIFIKHELEEIKG